MFSYLDSDEEKVARGTSSPSLTIIFMSSFWRSSFSSTTDRIVDDTG